MEEGDLTIKKEVKEKSTLIELLEEAIENEQALLFSLPSSLLQSLLNDDFYRNQKKQPVLNAFKAEVFTNTAAIVK